MLSVVRCDLTTSALPRGDRTATQITRLPAPQRSPPLTERVHPFLSTWFGPGTGQPRGVGSFHGVSAVAWIWSGGNPPVSVGRHTRYASQIRPFGDGAGPILTDSVLRRFWRPFEVFIEAGS